MTLQGALAREEESPTMKATTYPDLPGWKFDVTERSVGVYVMVATDWRGHSVSLEGTDPYELLDQGRTDAIRIGEMMKLNGS